MGSINNRMIAVMRLVMALSILCIYYFDGVSAGQHAATPTVAILICYSIFSALLYVFELYQRPLIPALTAHWIDVGWYTLLIAVSNDVNSIYLYGFFFCILIASFRWGFKSGLRVVVVSALIFIIVGLITAPVGTQIGLNHFSIRPVFLTALGYMVAYWGGQEITLKRRLALLRVVNTLSNPRFGVDRTIGSVMERLRTFYEADVCLMVMADLQTADYQLRRADHRHPEQAVHAEAISAEMVSRLLALPAAYGIIYRNGNCGQWWRRWSQHCLAIDVEQNVRPAVPRNTVGELATALDSQSFITVPMRYRNEYVGRIFLTSSRAAFQSSDVGFILQVIDQVMPVIDNIRLVDRLALDAAEYERQKIARDIHDSVIQPYIGLQIGLTAIRQKLNLGIDVTHNVESLLQITGEEVADLRRFVTSLKSNREQADNLLPAVRRFAAKFDKVSGIKVEVDAPTDIRVNDRLAAEVFQMIAEGLSNVRRHTESRRVAIGIACRDNQLTVRITNDNTNGSAADIFAPRSITERAAALGGRAHVKTERDGDTVITVEIPL